MAYAKDGYPVEQASKIGHLKLVGNELIRRVIEDFEDVSPSSDGPKVSKTGSVDLTAESGIRRIVTVDGGQAVVPNPARREKAMAFVQVAACLLRMDDLRYMREHPLMDPRDVNKMIEGAVWYNPAAIPLAGVHHPGLTVQQTIRRIVDRTLSETGLYETLSFLVYRGWETDWGVPEEERPHMSCVSCDREISLPRWQLSFECPECGSRHTLSDYLSIGTQGPEDWSREEAASALRDALETLSLMHFLRVYRDDGEVLGETLFVKDGPLLLRAALSRLVVPIRDFIAYLRSEGRPPNLVGVEKTGNFAGFLEEYRQSLEEPGDYFLPSVRFVVEEITGSVMTEGYRNRVSYGAKMGVRIGPDHLLALNVPTGPFLTEPEPEDLVGFEASIRSLSELVSYRYPNALIPLVLANSAASIARRPSGNILSAFADSLMHTTTTPRP